MTDVIETNEQDEMATLKATAELMGISYHPSIGIDKLRSKIEAGTFNTVNNKTDPVFVAPVIPVVPKEIAGVQRARMAKEANALVRIRLSCMNPAKKDWDGEIITVGNSVVGSIKKFIPFNADDGWHVPRIMLEMLRNRKCQVFTTERSKNGVNVRKGKLIKEFSIEILDPLTQIELNELARRQAMLSSTE